MTNRIIISINESELIAIMKGDLKSPNLPKDTNIIRIYQHHDSDFFDFVIDHKSFEGTPPYSAYPHYGIDFFKER